MICSVQDEPRLIFPGNLYGIFQAVVRIHNLNVVKPASQRFKTISGIYTVSIILYTGFLEAAVDRYAEEKHPSRAQQLMKLLHSGFVPVWIDWVAITPKAIMLDTTERENHVELRFNRMQ